MTSRSMLSVLLLLSSVRLSAQPPADVHYIERRIRVPIAGSVPGGVDVLEVYVDAPGRHPLALLTHGTSAVPQDRMELSPWMQLWQAFWFAQRGYVALVVIREGYGLSGGRQDTAHGGCSSDGSFVESGEESAEELRHVAEYAAKNLPEVDPSTVVSAGVSTGGFAQVALAADPPANLKAAISFAGGRGGDGAGHLCDEGGLIAAFKNFGKHAKAPMLWIYADNDKWFIPAEATKFHEAYQGAGGNAEFIHAPAIGDDGHQLYSHVPAWSDTVDAFLRKQNLLPLAAPYPEPQPPANVTPPPGLSDRGIAAFRLWLLDGPFKSFATDGAGAYGYSDGRLSQAFADSHALENCNKNKHAAHTCAIVARTK